jgi:arylsulfatase A-like enzyme
MKRHLLLLALLPTLLSAAPPNIVMVFIDDMGWADFSCFGNQEAKTPNVDRMAAEGIRFTQFYVNSPICSPSRSALTTGQYPQRWKITSYLNNRADNERRGVAQWLDLKAPTMARILQQNGYATGHFGKWHLGGQRDVDDAPPITAYGFDESLTNFEGMGPKLLPLTLKPGDAEPKKIWGDAERLGKPFTWMLRSKITGGFVDAAIPFIDKASAAKKPFFVNLWPDDVHGPWWPPTGQVGRGQTRALPLRFGRNGPPVRQTLRSHSLHTPELRDNTLVLICSDNGPEPGAGSAGPFRGSKTTLYEGGTRSPLVVWGPGLIDKSKAGSQNEKSVFAAFDLAPSLLSIAGIDAKTSRSTVKTSLRPCSANRRSLARSHFLASPSGSQNRLSQPSRTPSGSRHARRELEVSVRVRRDEAETLRHDLRQVRSHQSRRKASRCRRPPDEGCACLEQVHAAGQWACFGPE